MRHFLVIGAQRSGTSYLRDMLAEHPAISMAEPARPEPKVFLAPDPPGHAAYDAAYFGHADEGDLLGEKSTSYLEDVACGERAVAVLGHDVRFLVQVRDPVARAVSHWRFSTDHGFENRGLTEALTANLDGPLPWDPARTSVSPYAYLERGRYADYLRPWLERWPGRVRVQFLEDLAATPRVIAATYAWLGVDPGYRPAGLGRATNASRAAVPRLGSKLQAALREWFADADAELAALLGMRLPWSPREEA